MTEVTQEPHRNSLASTSITKMMGLQLNCLEDTDEERVLRAAKETGILTQGTNIEGVETVVDLIDDYKSD